MITTSNVGLSTIDFLPGKRPLAQFSLIRAHHGSGRPAASAVCSDFRRYQYPLPTSPQRVEEFGDSAAFRTPNARAFRYLPTKIVSARRALGRPPFSPPRPAEHNRRDSTQRDRHPQGKPDIKLTAEIAVEIRPSMPPVMRLNRAERRISGIRPAEFADASHHFQLNSAAPLTKQSVSNAGRVDRAEEHRARQR